VKRDDAGLTVALVGLFAVVVGMTDIINRYLRPSMKIWIVASGVVLTGLGVAVLVTGWRDRRHARSAGRTHATQKACCSTGDDHDDHHHHRYSRVGWLLVVPLVGAIVVNPGALGSYAVGRQSSSRTLASLDFDLDAHLRSHSFGGQAPELNIAQVQIAAADPDQAPLLAETTVVVDGFVVNGDRSTDGFLLARIMVGCCAGDGLPLSIDVRGDDGPPHDEDQWVRVRGTLDLPATEAHRAGDDPGGAVFDADSVEAISEPSEPYLYPY
jgi:uncharacterized repeat protein (TIGR03943 family)